MHGDLIAIDLETTGLDSAQDAIIEIGAVRLREGKVIEEYGTLIDPQRPIPEFITGITGITNDDVTGQPPIAQELPRLKAFAGDAPLIAHNISVDVSFLTRLGVLQNNLRIDTLELSTALLPRAPRHALGSLTTLLGIELEHAHRALDDARATALLYWRLWERALALPVEILQEICTAAGRFPWDARPVFEAALREKTGGLGLSADTSAASAADLIEAVAPIPAPAAPAVKRPASAAVRITPAAFFAANGPLAASLPGYEAREGQTTMAEAVQTALDSGKHLMVEAATGIGKTLAYLEPALAWADANGKRIVISTSTIALQEQLMAHDLPLVRDALGLDMRAAVLKGRGNYLCPRRLATLRARGPSNPDELRVLARLLIWQLETDSGDKQDIGLRGSMEHAIWTRLSAEDEDCTTDTCAAIGGICPFYRARTAAETAQVVVVNHALLVADALAPQPVLPEYDAVIIDEAQHLEEATTSSLSFHLDVPQLKYHLSDLSGKSRGLISDLLRALATGAPEATARQYTEYAELIREAARLTASRATALFDALDALYGEFGRPDTQALRLTGRERKHAHFEHATGVWNELRDYFDALVTGLRRLSGGMQRLSRYPIPNHADLANALAAASRYTAEIQRQLDNVFAATDSEASNNILWLTRNSERGVVLHSAPAHIGQLIDANLWSAKSSVILTGATLRTGQTFTFLGERLGAANVETLIIPSPFDYKQAVLLYLPTDLAEPNERSRFQSGIERAIVELATALDGHVLALFTSYMQLRQTAQAIGPRLALGGIDVLEQNDAGRQLVIDSFRDNPRSVLLGTRSFWEGIDLPGDLVRGLVIVRLPFSVPNEPIFAARAEQYADSFNQYSVPEAILKFRQGFGRLIRSKTDRGVVTVLDGRLIGKGYGKLFLESLPECTTLRGPLGGMADAARKWMAEG
ncbi:MAG: DEAD/DEAH box helicase [Anaerolineae bacterium]|nr:DEAD/DEAH box helicase [Anaerolineae bacterium]